MLYLSIIVTIILSLCSTAILSYISLAVPIGPWIEPTIVLIAMLMLGLLMRNVSLHARSHALTLVTAGASIGGILATGCGFAFPTLYFLDQEFFTKWLQSPLYFMSIMTGISLTAGSLGLVLANACEHYLLDSQGMSFPIGQLAHKMIGAQNQLRKSRELALGFIVSAAYSVLQAISGFIPASITMGTTHSWGLITIPSLKLPLAYIPMLWSIGFVTGHVIAIPLAVGIFSKLVIINPLSTAYFSHIKPEEFLLAFCSGLIAYGALLSFFELPKFLIAFIKNKSKQGTDYSLKNLQSRLPTSFVFLEWLLVLTSTCAVLYYFNFSVIAQLYIIIFTLICAYQLLVIGGKIGLAPMGKFATFVMLPGIFLFGFNAVQATFVATFVEICGGVAVDVLFGRKMARLAGVEPTTVMLFQWLGVFISSLAVGGIFWILITHFGLGSEHLVAQRAQSRALLINAQSFDFFAVLAGALFGALLKDLHVNPMLVLGGVLMPLEWSLILMLSGLSTYLVNDRESQYPLWSGVFAANSLWMLVKALLKY